MIFAKVYSAQAHVLAASIITIEADISRGLHSFSIVGLPDKAIEEAKDRISAAIKNSSFNSPKSKSHKVVISLAPADLRKEGPLFDVPLALAYLLAAQDIKFNPAQKLFLGELSLDGSIRPVPGVLPLVRAALQQGFTEIYVPEENAEEASLVLGSTIYPINNLKALIDHLHTETIKPYVSKRASSKLNHFETAINEGIDVADINGQNHTKRALEIVAAGGHNCALYGPPGTGKTMLAKAFCTILPDLTYEQQLDVVSIHSVAGLNPNPLTNRPPFRAPHHLSSPTAIFGGGSIIKPGEITLAHHGVLFLDEFPEFDRRVIDSLRQPLEEHSIYISRSKGSVHMPAHCQVIIAFNPCPCGNFNSIEKNCICTASTIAHYQKKLSGPIIDRIDIWSNVQPIARSELISKAQETERSTDIKRRVIAARAIQQTRFKDHPYSITTNHEMTSRDIKKYCTVIPEAEKVLLSYSEKLKLSPRSHHKIIKIARTIADLEQKEKIDVQSILEAFQYRPQFSSG